MTTEDLLFGVGATYGDAFEHALAIRATSSTELLEVLQRREERLAKAQARRAEEE